MWKVIWKDVTGYPFKEETYDNFSEARREFRIAIKDAVGNRVTEMTDYIDKYCKKFYRENVPHSFEQLKNFIVKFVTDINYPSTNSDCNEMDAFEDFTDEKVEFWFDESWGLEISLNDDVKFPTGYISAEIVEPITDEPYCFIIEDWRKQFANNRIFAHILLQEADKYDEMVTKRTEEMKRIFGK